jgi:hypothetical protein
MGDHMTDYNVYETDALKALLDGKQAKRNDLDYEIKQISTILNTRLAQTYRFIRFTAMKQGQLDCIKTLRNASCAPGGCYMGLKEAKELTDQLKGQFIRPFTVEFRHLSDMPEVIQALHECFECEPVEGGE